ncbi:MAG: zinc dependent phospholipase C family protein [Nitrospiraceae bacterium]|nr:zinc dependent phospholipase C family protein [Nitrospiraceae bacterium]
MFICALTFFIFVFFFPSHAFAWGPLTHIYLGTEVFLTGATALPGTAYAVIKKFRQDYLYGNIMADIIFAKKYLPKEKNPHNWDVAFELLEDARTEPEKAFGLGYLSHLAADTVAHSILTKGKKNIGHTYIEMRADSLIDRHYWMMAMSIDRKVQRRGDVLVERCLESPLFSFKTNKRIFKGIVLFSGLSGRGQLRPFPALDISFNSRRIGKLHEESLFRIVDVLEKGRNSKVLKKDPTGGILLT